MKKYTVSLQLAKELKKAGFPQETQFYYQGVQKEIDNEKGYALNFKENLYSHKDIINVAAPIADEILGKLPAIIKYNNLVPHLMIEKSWLRGEWYWMVYFADYSVGTILDGQSDLTLANAAAKMYVYLEKHNLLEGGSV